MVQSNFRRSNGTSRQDIFNNLFAPKQVPQWTKEEKTRYFHHRDRDGKVVTSQYTTKEVEDTLSAYIESCEKVRGSVTSVFMELSEDLFNTGQLPTLVQAAHVNIIRSRVS